MSYSLNIDSIFASHPADTEEKQALHSRVRGGAGMLAKDWEKFLPPCEESKLAIRRLQEAMMYANSAIAQFDQNYTEADKKS